MFWELGVRTQDFAKASTVILRSWDDGMNTQPNTITWNIIGQMNNCNFIVKVREVWQAGASWLLRWHLFYSAFDCIQPCQHAPNMLFLTLDTDRYVV